MKLIQIDQCCSWKTADGKFQIDYWTNANRPRRANGTDGGYGMYTVTALTAPMHPNTFVGAEGSFTSKRDAIAAIRRYENSKTTEARQP